MTLEQALAALAEMNKKLDAAQAELEKLRTDSKRRDDSALDALQKQVDTMRAAKETAEGEVKRLQDAKKNEPSVDEQVTRKLAIVDGARALHAKPGDVDTSKSEREIMVAALKSRDPSFKDQRADGKPESDDYVRARFDMAVESQKKADASNAGMNRDSGAGGAGSHTFAKDSTDELDRIFKSYDEAPDRVMKAQRDAWRSDAEKKRFDGISMPPRRPLVYADRFDARDMFQRIDAWLRNALPGYGRKDADPSTLYVPRQLMYIMTVPYDFLYPEIMYSQIFPVTNEVPTGANSYEFKMYDEIGQADIVDNYADEAPNVERKAIELIGKIVPVRDSWSITLQDIRNGSFANVPIESMKSVTARRLIERKCDALAATGDTAHSISGVANNSLVPTYTLATKAAGTTRWGSLSGSTITYVATPEEILRDLGGMATQMKLTTKGAIQPDTIILGTQNTAVIDNLRLDQYNQATVGDYLRTGKLPWLKNVFYWPRLDTAGASAKERIIVCKRDPNIFRFVVPQEFEQFPPEQRNLAFITQCHKRWADPQMIQPNGFIYADGSTQ